MQGLRITCALLFASARLASAGPGYVNLSWIDCGASGAQNRAFACNTNSGSFALVGSFLAPSGVIAASGIVSTLHIQSTGSSLPSWWGMAPGLCRAGSLTASFDFTSNFQCLDYWQGGASGSIVMDFPAANRTMLSVAAALPAGSPLITSITEGDEVYAFKAVVDAAKTTGPGACAGCQTGVSICVSSITITQPAGTPGGDLRVSLPAARNFATWQGGNLFPYVCDATPARNTTWGSIKTLYR